MLSGLSLASDLEYPVWSSEDARARFLELVKAANFNTFNVPIPKRSNEWSDDELRKFLFSEDSIDTYIQETFADELSTIDAEMQEIISKQNEYMDKLKIRYETELIPLAKKLNDKTNAFNRDIEEFNALQDTLNSNKQKMSRDHLLSELTKELNEHQKSTSEVVDHFISQENVLSDGDLSNLIKQYTAKRIDWYLIKEKIDIVDKNGITGF